MPTPPAPPSRRLLLITGVAVVGLIAALIIKASVQHPTARSSDGAEETRYPTPSVTTTESIALPPGMGPPRASEDSEDSEESASSASQQAGATPSADRVLDALASITDPQKWAQQFAIVWNSFTPVGGRADQWVANVSNYSTGPCQSLIGRDGGAPWAQAMMSNMTVTTTGTPSAQQLWTVDDSSMWRVTTQITMQSVDRAYKSMDGTSSTTWDFYLKRQRSGTYLLDSYSTPTPANTNKDTYTPAR